MHWCFCEEQKGVGKTKSKSQSHSPSLLKFSHVWFLFHDKFPSCWQDYFLYLFLIFFLKKNGKNKSHRLFIKSIFQTMLHGQLYKRAKSLNWLMSGSGNAQVLLTKAVNSYKTNCKTMFSHSFLWSLILLIKPHME